jgi:hypothetical protein
MNRGFIKIWRCIEDSGLIQNASALQLAMWCLLKASHKKRKQIVGTTSVELMPGQFIFGRKIASKDLKTTEQKIRTSLKLLKNTDFLTVNPTNKYSIITIVNWDTYQSSQPAANQQPSQVLTSSQPAANHKQECKEEIKKEETQDDFDIFWNMYAKKKDTAKCKAKWKKLSPSDKDEIFKTLGLYLESTPDKQYRKNPLTYLNGEIWKDDFTPEPEYNEDGNLVTPVVIDWDAIAKVKAEAPKE